MKYINIILIFLILTFFNELVSQEKDDFLPLKTVNIAIVKDGPASFNNILETNLKNEIISLLSSQALAHFSDEDKLTGKWTMNSVNKIIDSLLSEPKVDIVIALGAIASQNVCLRKEIKKPVIAPYVIDPKRQNIPYENGTSGVNNLSYIIMPQRDESDMKFFAKLVTFKNITIIFSKIYLKEMFDLTTLNSYTDSATGIRVDYILADSSAEQIITALPNDVEAVYFSNMLHFSTEESVKLVTELNNRKIPSFATSSDLVKLGFLVSLNPNIQDRIIKRISFNIQQILLGEKPSSFPVSIFSNSEMTINLKTMEKIQKMAMNWDILTNADIVESGWGDNDKEQYDIQEIMKMALDNNIDLSAKKLEIQSAEKNIDIKKSNFLPQIDLTMQGQKGGKSTPEEDVQLQLSANQLIYSHSVRSDLSITELNVAAKQNELLATKLDIMKQTVDYYLEVIKSRNAFLILWENLKITRTNLTIAKQKFEAGAVDKSEPIRWESQVATSKKNAIQGYSVLVQSLLQLLQILHSTNLNNHDIANLTIEDPLLLTSKKEFIQIIENPMYFNKLSKFFIDEAIENSPEIKQIDNYIKAKKDYSDALTKSHYIPEFYGFGYFYNYFYKSETVLPLPDRDWNVGVKMTLPLFKGFAVTNSTEQAEIDIQQLLKQRNSAVEKIEQSVKTSLNYLEATYFNIKQSNVAQKSAEENLQLINNSYMLGQSSFLLLLDAQTQLLSAKLEANDSYNLFLRTYFDIQRLVNRFEPMMTPAELDDYFKRMTDYLK